MNLLGIFIVFSSLFLAVPGIISYYSGSKKKGRTLLRLSLLITIAYVILNILIMNEKVGDASLYARYFYSIRSSGLVTAIKTGLQEYGFIFLTWLIGRFTGNYHIYRVVLFLLQLCLITFAFRRIKIEPYYLLVIFFLWYVFFLAYIVAAIRQGIAMCIFIYIISFMESEERKVQNKEREGKWGWIKIFVSILLMMSFHKTSILIAPGIIVLYFSVIKNYGGKKLSLYLSIVAIIISIVMLLWGNVESYFEGEYYTKMIKYSTSEARQIYGSEGIRFDFIFFVAVPLILSVLILRKKHTKFKIIRSSYIYSFLAFIPFCTMPYSDRIAAYTFIQIPLLLFSSMSEMKQKIIYHIFLVSIFIATGFIKYWVSYLEVQGFTQAMTNW